MTNTMNGLELRLEVTPQRELKLSLEAAAAEAPGPNEVVVRIETAPLNPSDLRLLIGPADLSTLSAGVTDEHPKVTFREDGRRTVVASVGCGDGRPRCFAFSETPQRALQWRRRAGALSSAGHRLPFNREERVQ